MATPNVGRMDGSGARKHARRGWGVVRPVTRRRPAEGRRGRREVGAQSDARLFFGSNPIAQRSRRVARTDMGSHYRPSSTVGFIRVIVR